MCVLVWSFVFLLAVHKFAKIFGKLQVSRCRGCGRVCACASACVCACASACVCVCVSAIAVKLLRAPEHVESASHFGWHSHFGSICKVKIEVTGSMPSFYCPVDT